MDEVRVRQAYLEPSRTGTDGVVFVLAAGGLRYMNGGGGAFLGYAPGELFWRDALGLVHEDDLPAVLSLISRIKAEPAASAVVECRMRDAAGSWRVMEAAVQNVLEAPAASDGGLLVVDVRDISERRALEERLAFWALHDPLTGLANRTLFMDRLGHALSHRDREVAVLFMDLDDFKVVNDSLGHETGDRLLVAVAERLRASLRPSDTAARLGGDEFAVSIEDARGGTQAPFLRRWARAVHLLKHRHLRG